MPQPSALETFTAGEETFVDVAHVERQLAELWQAASDSDSQHQRAITRACMYNLILVVGDETERDSATDTVRSLTSRHPCRAIVILQEPRASGTQLSASITAHCHLAAGGGKQVCCEQITLHATGPAVEQVPGAVLPLLESDLPTILWWRENFLEQAALCQHLTDAVDRIFYDTSWWGIGERDVATVGRLLEFIRSNPRKQFCDLSWTRLGLWRQLTADFFQHPQCGAELTRLNRVEIVYGGGAGAQLRAMLYAGWIAAQLNWDAASSRERFQIRLGQDTGEADVGLLRIDLYSADAQFSLRKNHGEQATSTIVHMESMCEMPRKRAFWPTDDVSLIAEELDRPYPHRVYERALQKLTEIWG